ncbi:hypothetical protein B0A55_06019 [Friedmanniomyces simplex]|uniref:Uncharacterized protein n=1 Tax=Friedmanniomyces simplex TaxID=329884 RepID=A0A4U0XET5_9PEZI|nr:hypothetical protein B0A55_06019 [Friedmanniomyces simplex]
MTSQQMCRIIRNSFWGCPLASSQFTPLAKLHTVTRRQIFDDVVIPCEDVVPRPLVGRGPCGQPGVIFSVRGAARYCPSCSRDHAVWLDQQFGAHRRGVPWGSTPVVPAAAAPAPRLAVPGLTPAGVADLVEFQTWLRKRGYV